ncbi:hypothetical protein FRC12_006665 [Ceratobasidium sp. 428]|nr:hypothetical protein FRC12_006665 [Ceratobasidium sp. 428]
MILSQPVEIPSSSPSHFPTWAAKCAGFQDALEEWKAARMLLASSIKSYLDACTTLATTYAQPPFRYYAESTVEEALTTVDSELDSLASEEHALRNIRISLATMRNRSATLARINTLPPEILAQVFVLSRTHCVHDNSLKFHDLAGVCAYWQQIALDTLDLWTHIDIGPGTPLNLAKLLLQRTRDSPIHVHLHEPEAEKIDNRLIPTPDHEVSKAITVLTPHIHRVCTLDIESYSYSRVFIRALLNLWLTSGSATLSKSLSVFRPSGEQLLYPYGRSKNGMLKSRSENANELLSSLSTLHLHRVKFDWHSGAYKNLIDLRLDLPCQNAPISVSDLAAILTSNPIISILKLGRLRVTSPEDWTPPAPISLKSLKVLNIANLQSDSLRLVLPLVALPSFPDKLSVGISVVDELQSELESFFVRSQMTTLYCRCSGGSAWRARKTFPCLDTLILYQFVMTDEPAAEEGTASSQLIQYTPISSIILLSSIVSFTGLERFVTEHSVQHISLEKCEGDLEHIQNLMMESHPELNCSISSIDSTSRWPCRTMFDHVP